MYQSANLTSDLSAGIELAPYVTHVHRNMFSMKLENVTARCHTNGGVARAWASRSTTMANLVTNRRIRFRVDWQWTSCSQHTGGGCQHSSVLQHNLRLSGVWERSLTTRTSRTNFCQKDDRLFFRYLGLLEKPSISGILRRRFCCIHFLRILNYDDQDHYNLPEAGAFLYHGWAARRCQKWSVREGWNDWLLLVQEDKVSFRPCSKIHRCVQHNH